MLKNHKQFVWFLAPPAVVPIAISFLLALRINDAHILMATFIFWMKPKINITY